MKLIGLYVLNNKATTTYSVITHAHVTTVLGHFLCSNIAAYFVPTGSRILYRLVHIFCADWFTYVATN